MSARRQLWGSTISLIHLENSALQLRKTCECIASLCVVAADIEFNEIPNVRRDYQIGKVFTYLSKHNKLKFPNFARLEKLTDNGEGPIVFKLTEKPVEKEEIDRVKSIHNRCGRLMHERAAYSEWPNASEAPVALWQDLNALRGDHQWLWNQFWQHSNRIKGELFFMSLGENSSASRPTAFKTDKLTEADLAFDFDPEFLADFTGEVDWTESTN